MRDVQFAIQTVTCKTECRTLDVTYTATVPKLWDETIDAHRAAVRDAVLDTTAELATRHGLRSVTMSQIAAETGIGRATLYKYFSDVETILTAWHERQIGSHLGQLVELRDRPGRASERLEAVLEAYAFILRGHHSTELAAILHQGDHATRAEHHLRELVRDLLAEGAASGDLRGDVAPDELANYCLHALTASAGLPSKAAVRRLVGVTLAGLRPSA